MISLDCVLLQKLMITYYFAASIVGIIQIFLVYIMLKIINIIQTGCTKIKITQNLIMIINIHLKESHLFIDNNKI